VISLALGVLLALWPLNCGPDALADWPDEDRPAGAGRGMAQPSDPAVAADIAFESLGKGNSFTAQLDYPAVLIADNPGEALQIGSLLDSHEITAAFQNVDFGNKILVVVLSGKVGNDGYSISVNRVRNISSGVAIEVDLGDPLPGQIASDVISYPYHAILLPRAALQAISGVRWSMYDSEGRLLAERPYP
jgi:hypothetical protein